MSAALQLTETIQDAPARPSVTGHLAACRDGTELFYRHFHPARPSLKAVILLHRGHEHSGRYDDLVRDLDLEDTHVFAWDARGHGLSPGERGDAPSFACLVRDLDDFVSHVARRHHIPVENMVVMANSVGSVVAATWVHDHAPPIRALVLGTPALRVKLYVPFALFFLRLAVMLMPRLFIKSYVSSRLLTHDEEQARAYDRDPLIARSIAVRVLVGMFDAARRITNDAGAIHVPVLMQSAGADHVVHLAPQEELFAGLSSEWKRMHVYPGFHHDIFHEADRHLPITEAAAFIRQAFRALPVPVGAPSPRAQELHDAHSRPLPPWSLRRWAFAAYGLFLSTVGRLSMGVSIGFRHGFDSGRSLDHVYENQPRGVTFLGRLVDRVYLGSVGWRGIRRRRENLEKAMAACVQTREATVETVRVLDVATGSARYLVDLARRHPVELVLRDFADSSVDAARALVAEHGLAHVDLRRADAFDPAEYHDVGQVDVAVVSGLFELFPGNARVARALDAIHGVLKPGGFLVYTNQPWHPQLEMIARVLPNRDGAPWVMRCRSQGEMDGLVDAAGFRKFSMDIDDDGIFSVSIVRRPG